MRNSKLPLAFSLETGVYARCTNSPVSFRFSRTKTCCPTGRPSLCSGDVSEKVYVNESWLTRSIFVSITGFQTFGLRNGASGSSLCALSVGEDTGSSEPARVPMWN